jgi:putative cell wall-binding protein
MTTLSNYAPKQGTMLTARTVCLNAKGRPIPGLKVVFTWEFKTKTITEEAFTNAWGVAQSARSIGAASLDYRVRVRGTVQAGSSTRSSSKSFLPRENTTGLSFNFVSVFGSDRFKTAVAISEKVFYGTADTVVIATGRNFPDALGGAALAGGYGAPILLTDTRSLPSAVSAEIKRLGATKAIVLGSTGAVASSVETALRSAGVKSITRIGGSSRYVTARNIAKAVIAKAGTGWDGTAFVATGVNFPDALAASPVASARRWPIYLSDPTGDAGAFAAQMKSDGVKKVIILGGSTAVSPAYQDALVSAIGSVTRIAGDNRYATGAMIASYGVESAGLTWDAVSIATGQNFPDALAGGIFGAERGSVILLTSGKSLSAEPAAALTGARDDIGTVHFLGGTTAVSNAVRSQVTAIIE